MDRISASEIVLHRVLHAPMERVWRFIVDPELRARWFMGGTSNLGQGGTIGFTMRHDQLSDRPAVTPEAYRAFIGAAWMETITAFDPPHLIAFEWEGGQGGEVTIRLRAEGNNKTHLTLVHSGLRGVADTVNFGGGWHAHLAALDCRLQGRELTNFWTLIDEGEQVMKDRLERPLLTPGRNIAIKVPEFRWEETVSFYRDRVGLEVSRTLEESIGFRFGEMTLWIDRVPHQAQVDVWLELFTEEPDAALRALESPRRNELEPLTGVTGHWTSDPAGTVLLVRREK